MNSRKWCQSGCGALHPERRELDSPSRLFCPLSNTSGTYLSSSKWARQKEKQTQNWEGTQNMLHSITAERISQELRAGELNKGSPDIPPSFVWLTLLKFCFSKLRYETQRSRITENRHPLFPAGSELLVGIWGNLMLAKGMRWNKDFWVEGHKLMAWKEKSRREIPGLNGVCHCVCFRHRWLADDMTGFTLLQGKMGRMEEGLLWHAVPPLHPRAPTKTTTCWYLSAGNDHNLHRWTLNMHLYISYNLMFLFIILFYVIWSIKYFF